MAALNGLRHASRLALLLYLLALGCGSAGAALFATPGQQLAQELRQASGEQRRLVLYFSLPSCTGCRAMKQQVFSDPRTEREFGRAYRTVHIDLGADTALTDSDGKPSSSRKLAQRLGVSGTPAFVFLDADGSFLYRHSGLIARPSDFVRLGRFVAQAGYDTQPFGAYLRQYSGALNAPASPLARVRAGQPPLDFALRDPHGTLRRLADFRGKAVALSVGYTQCPDVCPTTMAEMQQIVADLGRDADQLQVLFVTLDPERDQPDMLGAYMAAFHPDFLALRGSAAQTAAFIRRFDLVAVKRPLRGHRGYTLDHTAGVYLFDRNGHLRGVSPYGQPPDLLAEDVRTLVSETLAVRTSQR